MQLPPPPPPQPAPGTEEWARWQLLNAFELTDARAITDIVGAGLTAPYNGLNEARRIYCRVCHERHWPGWQARLAWAIIEQLLKPLDDDIPF